MSDAVTWANSTTTDGEWHGLSLVIDTDTYAVDIDREMLAACTGIQGEFSSYAAERLAETYDGPDLWDLIGYVTDVDADVVRDARSIAYPAPEYRSVRIPLRVELAADVLDGIKRRALAFAASGVVSPDGCVEVAPFRVTGFRMIRKRITTQSRDLGGVP